MNYKRIFVFIILLFIILISFKGCFKGVYNWFEQNDLTNEEKTLKRKADKNDYLLLFKPEYKGRFSMINAHTVKGSYSTLYFVYEENYAVIIHKIKAKRTEKLDNYVNIESRSPKNHGDIYQGFEGWGYGVSYKSLEDPIIDSLYIGYDHDFLLKKQVKDDLLNIQFFGAKVAIGYSRDGNDDLIFRNRNMKITNLPMNISLLKKNGFLYLIFVAPRDGQIPLDIDFITKLLND